MRIAGSDDGPVLIVAPADELREFIHTIEAAIEHGEWKGALLTEEGVDQVVVRCEE